MNKKVILKLLCLISLILYLINIVLLISKKNNPKETFHYVLYNNHNNKIIDIKNSILYNNVNLTGQIGQKIKFDIYNKIDKKNYTIMRYPDFRNEIKRHCSINFAEYFSYVNTMINTNKDVNYIFDYTGFHGILDNKVRLWISIKNKYGRDIANDIMGKTYLIPNDNELFINEYINNKKYILKNSFGGARSGLKITTDQAEILYHFNSNKEHRFDPEKCRDATCHSKVKYNIIQDYIEPTFLIKGHKVGLRMYLIIINNNESYNGYIYKDGILYYSTEKYNKNTTDLSNNVVGVATEMDNIKKKYNLPNTFNDFKKYVQKEYNDGDNKLNILNSYLKDYCNIILKSNEDNLIMFSSIKTFGVYALDIEITKDFKPYIFEANFYFTRYYSDVYLGKLMTNMYNDIYYKIGLSNKEKVGMWNLKTQNIY